MPLNPIIMVVDDDPDIGQLLTTFLGKRNHRMMFFTNGKDALDYLKNNSVLLLLTDLSMPEMTGIELTRQAKALYPNLPVIVMSGSGDGRDRDEIFALGADFIAKPFDLADLLARLERAINKDKYLSANKTSL